jgi:hypothetical protein
VGAVEGERLVEQDGAEAVILVGAVMVGLPRALESWAPEPLVEGMACGVLLADLGSASARGRRAPAAFRLRQSARS